MAKHSSCTSAVVCIFVIALGYCQDEIPTNLTGNDIRQNLSINHTSNGTWSQCIYPVFAIDCNPEAASCNSLSLDEIAKNSSLAARRDNCTFLNITINIGVNTLQLTKLVNFTDFHSLLIHGSNSKIACEDTDLGIILKSIEHVKLSSFTLSGCGLVIPLNRKIHFRSALHIWYCSEVAITSIMIANSTGSGLNFRHNRGNISVTGSTFINNTLISNQSVRVVGGSGVYVYISKKPSPQIYHFVDCAFIENVARSDRYNFVLSASGEGVPVEGKGRGGGMRITVQQYTNQASIFVTNSRFEKNQAFLGAGLSAEIEGNGNGNLVHVKNTSFIRNGCQSIVSNGERLIGIGGGVFLSFEHLNNLIQHVDVNNYTILLSSITFDANCAELGGGAFFFSDRARTPDSNNSIIFENSNWTHNFAHWFCS